MPRLEIESVVHVSSEDPLYPAKNLLSSAIGNDVKKWINQKNGEKQAYIVFKLKEKSQITNLTVGNQNSSFIELLVGDDNISEKEYQVLLPATEILTLREARGGSNKTGVHFFTKDDFNKEAVEKKWSRVKVVCSQPYDPHCRYGLSCFVLKSICDESEKSPKRNDTQTIAGEDKNDLSDDNKDDVNSWKQDMLKRLDASTSSPSQPSTSLLPFNRIKLNKPDDKNNQQKSPRKHSSNEKETTKQKEKKETTPKQKEKKEAPQRDPDPPERPQVDFNKILQDVRFSLSGYENPLRSEIRNKGLEMGAKYSNDWDARCTHLICAFINTPKFNKVKGQGKIVTRDWIEQCHSKRRRLPWRKFALDNRDRQQPISEEDEEDDKDKKETKNKARADRRRRLPSESSSDTEDEIQRVQARKQRKTATTTNAAAVTNGTAPKRNQKPATKTRDELYNADTDVSEDDEEDEFGGDNSDADPDFKPGSQEDPDDSFVVDDDDDHDVGDSETQVESDSDEDEPKKKKPRKVWMGKPLKVKKERKKGDVHDLSLVSRVAGALASDSDDDTKRPDTTNLELPALPEMPPHTYYIAEDEKGVFREYLIRYITAFDGTIFDQLSHRVDYAITDSKSIAEKIINEHPTVVTVKSEWIWDSYETDKLLPTDNYHFS